MCVIPFPSPFVVSVNSSCDFACLDFNILGAIQNLYSIGFTGGGDLAIGPVLIKSGTVEVTYREMLFEFVKSPYSVGITYVQSTAPGQSEEPIYLCKGGISELLVPTIDPYQDSPEIVALKRPYCIDGSTKIILGKLYPHSTVQFYFYPLDTVNLARDLCGRLPQKRFNSSILLTGK
jgi:hypothetical protein